jgi:hypothetical protein
VTDERDQEFFPLCVDLCCDDDSVHVCMDAYLNIISASSAAPIFPRRRYQGGGTVVAFHRSFSV